MSRNRVGDTFVAYMNREGEGYFGLCVLDGAMNDAVRDLDPPLKLWKNMNPHPLNRAQVAASWLARDGRFEISHIRAHDTLGRSRRLRLFTLKAEHRT